VTITAAVGSIGVPDGDTLCVVGVTAGEVEVVGDGVSAVVTVAVLLPCELLVAARSTIITPPTTRSRRTTILIIKPILGPERLIEG